MSEKETVGMTEQVKETKKVSKADEAKKKKAKYAMIKVIVALCAVLCIVLTVFEMGATYRAIKAVDVDGTEYSVAEYNWMYSTSVYEVYNNLYQSYGDLTSYFLNVQKPLDEQKYSEEETWADYIKAYADNALIEMTELYNAAKESGFVLPEEVAATIEAEWAYLEYSAAYYGTTVGSYVEMNYGRGVNEKVFKDMYERYLYSIAYAESFVEGQEVAADEIDAYYAENAADFDSVSFKYYFANGTDEEGNEKELEMQMAKNEAEAIVAGTEEVEFSTQKYALAAGLEEAYAEWLFDEARVAGDREMFEAEGGYYVFEFIGLDDLHYNTVNVRHILVAPKDTADEASWQEALAKAEEYKAEWEALGGSEEDFAEVAKEHSEDSNASAGGLYENVYKGQMVEEFENWCFDSARKIGDSDIVKTTYGYHVMYFSGEAQDYYSYVVENSIVADRYTEYLDGLVDGVEVVGLSGERFVAKHFN